MKQLPTSHQRHHSLDMLRAAAITYVFLFHYFILSHGQPAWLPNAAQFGWTGVDLFFVLSGYLISNQLFTEIKNTGQLSLGRFFAKRIFRIIPAYLVVVGIYFLIPAFREKEQLPPLWKFLTFTQNLGLNIKERGTFSHAWSLCVEEHFYLALPLLLILLQATNKLKNAVWLLIALFFSGFAIRYACYHNQYLPHATDHDAWVHWYKYIYYPTYNRLDGLLAGVAIAAIYNYKPMLSATLSKYRYVIAIAGILWLGIAYYICTDQQTAIASVYGYPAVALGFGLLLIAGISSRNICYRFKTAIITHIATLSYSIYLTHKGIIHLTHHYLSAYIASPNVMLLICAGNCMLAAYALHATIEKPFLRLRDKLIER